MNIYPTPEEKKAMILAQMHALRDQLRMVQDRQVRDRKKNKPKK